MSKDLIKRLRKKYGETNSIYFIGKYCELLPELSQKQLGRSRVYRELKSVLDDEPNQISTENIFTELQKKLYPLEDKELFLLSGLFAAAVLEKLSEPDLPRSHESKLFSLLRELELIDFEGLYTSGSSVDKILSKRNIYRYAISDSQTRAHIREKVYRFAKLKKISEIKAAEIYDPKNDKRKLAGKLYYPVIYFISLLMFTSIALFFGIVPALLSYLPMLALIKKVGICILSRILKPEYIPKLKGDKIPDSALTVCVITSVIDKSNISSLLKKLEDYRLRNKDDNLLLGILGDLLPSDHPEEKEDKEIINEVSSGINELNLKYGGGFSLFLRDRRYSVTEEKYIGKERKRGAVIELCRLFAEKDDSFKAVICEKRFLSSAKYLITLDYDTTLGFDDAKGMVLAMLHPDNKPKIQNGVVVSGHAIMQPSVHLERGDCVTPFLLTMFGNGGTDTYSTSGFEIFQSLFGKGSFCGKGIIDIGVFNKIIPPAFLDGTILSHDILEGAYLRAGSLTSTVLTDSSPKNPISYYKRLHRWIRGDIQSIPYLKSKVTRADGTRIKNPLDVTSRLMSFENILKCFEPIAVFFLMVYSFVTDRHPAAFTSIALLPIIFDFVLGVISDISSRRVSYFSEALADISRLFCLFFYKLSAIPSEALISLDAILRSTWRMTLSKKRLLSWQTSEASEKIKNKFFGYILKFLPSVIIGVLTVYRLPEPFFDFFGILWILFPVTAYSLSFTYRSSTFINQRAKNTLRDYSLDMWGYFSDNVNEKTNHLPPDNIQLSPVKAVAMRTSPTNIGLYLLSCIAAYKFGFIDISECLQRLNATLEAVKRLPKYNGHLYNWYDIKTLSVIGTPYISSVDSGNFIACIITLKEAIKAFEGDREKLACEIVSICDELIGNASFRSLYNRQKGLLAIGFSTTDGSLGNDAYDTFMSESRTAVYIAAAKGDIPVSAWYKMGRPVTLSGGHLGLRSWSGTMFEYFMPAIFLPTYHGTLLYEALGYAASTQISDKTHGIWGRSESGYYLFDYDMNYQYRAFGCRGLAIDKEISKNNVIAPYSSFLSLCAAPLESLKNLEALKAFPCYGKYGFYEAIDFTHSRVGNGNAVIKSFMSHHIGMSLLSAYNAVSNGYFQKAFMSDPEMSAASTLLREKVPVNIKKESTVASVGEEKLPKASYKPLEHSPENGNIFPETASCLGGDMRLTVSSVGDAALFYKQKALSFPFFGKEAEKHGLKLRINTDIAMIDPLKNAVFTPFLTGAFWKKKEKGITSAVSMSIDPDCNAVVISLDISGNQRMVTPMLSLEPILDYPRDYSAHPAFSGLSVRSKYDSQSGILFFSRKERRGEHKNTVMGIVMSFAQLEFITRKDEAFDSMYGISDISSLPSKLFSSQDGDCILPFCAVKKASETPNGKYKTDIIIFAGSSEEEIISNSRKMKSLKEKSKKSYIRLCSDALSSSAQGMFYMARADTSVIRLCSCLRSRFMYTDKKYTLSGLETDIGVLYKNGISGDLPIVLLKLNGVGGEETKNILGIFASACRYMKLLCEPFDLIILCCTDSNGNSYFEPIRSFVTETVSERVGYSPLFRKGGIFIASGDSDLEKLSAFSDVYIDITPNITAVGIIEALKKKDDQCRGVIKELNDVTLRPSYTPAHPTMGDFINDGFEIKKGISKRPWSYVYSTRLFGTLLTGNSLGYTWYLNSREGRLSARGNDPLLEFSGERLILSYSGSDYDLAAISERVKFLRSNAVYSGSVGGIDYEIIVGISPSLPYKYIKAELKNMSDSDLELSLSFKLIPDSSTREQIRVSRSNSTLFFTPLDTSVHGNISVFLHGEDKDFVISPQKKASALYVIGAVNRKFDKAFYTVIDGLKSKELISKLSQSYSMLYKPYFEVFHLDCSNKALEEMFNYYLIYQAVCLRLYARSGFYQSGGAYGFRDQLQDAMCLCEVEPVILKMQLIRSASKQYADGDVMHWWHDRFKDSYSVLGIRTRCSDDLLWLPFCAAEYLRICGDRSVFDTVISYIESPPLENGVLERCETPARSPLCESLFYHCVRAIERAISLRGENGLMLMGSCDWNDGFSAVGKRGKGTSVWLTRFASLTLQSFSNVCKALHHFDYADKYLNLSHELNECVENHCFNGEYYVRAFYDDGSVLGDKSSDECKIDILPQAFSVFTSGKNNRTVSAMKKAIMELYKSDQMLLALFSPPFENSKKDPGYIKAYVPGTRENGGQYTHAAIWGALGCFGLDMNKEGYDIICGSNPAFRYKNEHLSKSYGGEPYFVSGDIYLNKYHMGEAGWTGYTGAAGWMFKAILEGLLGYREYMGKEFTLKPHLSESFKGFKLTVNKYGTKYNISVSLGGNEKYLLDGKECENLFIFDGKSHNLQITVDNNKKTVV